MSSVKISVEVSDGGVGEPTPLGNDVRSVYFRLPNGAVLEVEAFARDGEDIIQIRSSRGAPFVVARSGNVLGVGVQKWG